MKIITSLFALLAPLKLWALTINLIAYMNGVGIDRDLCIMAEELKKHGHTVNYINIRDLDPRPKVDINIFLETLEGLLFELADKNYLLANPEWTGNKELVPKLDLILCKTKECERVFKPANPNTAYISFTSYDQYSEGMKKQYTSPLHLAGKSVQKGTNALYDLWKNNPSLPNLLMVQHIGQPFPKLANLQQVREYLSYETLQNMLNNWGIHLCPSETEGFGHYIMEAMSCCAVVVTVDAPPMNEFITDPRCLVKYGRTKEQNFATCYYFDPEHLKTVLTELLKLPESELQEIGRKNREFYLENDRFFKKRIAEIFGDAA